MSYDINQRECGLSYKPTEIPIHFDRKCFSNAYQNQTVLYIFLPTLSVFNETYNRIYNGFDAEEWEAPWTVYIIFNTRYESFTCTGVLVTFQWVLTSAHCLNFTYEYNIFIALFEVIAN